jgi:hypothetical protein
MGTNLTRTSTAKQSLSELKISPPDEGNNETPKDFPLFSLLPTELRLKIWERAFQDLPGRIVILKEILPESRLISARFFCKRPVPSLAHVCREASFVVRSSNLFFEDEANNPFWTERISYTQICFNVEKDTLLLGPQFRMQQIEWLQNAVPEVILKRLKRFGVEFGFRRHPRGSVAKWELPLGWDGLEVERIYEAFPELESLVFVPHHDYLGDGSDCYLGEVKFEWPKKPGWEQREWEEYVEWVRSEYEHQLQLLLFQRHWKSLLVRTPVVEFMGLTLAGGDMERCWDPVTRRSFWVLANEERNEE